MHSWNAFVLNSKNQGLLKSFPKELPYLALFGASFAITIIALGAGVTYLTSFSGTVAHSCQAVTRFVADWRFFLGLGLGALVLNIVLKCLATWVKASQITRLAPELTQPLPKKLLDVLKKAGVPTSTVTVTAKPGMMAVTTGWLQTKILLSQDLVIKLTPKQLEAVVLHERHHALQHHPVLFFWLELVANSLWFIPSLKELQHYVLLSFEQAADQAAVEFQKTTRHLRLALAHVLEHPQTPQVTYLQPSFVSTKTQLEHRVTALTNSEYSDFTSPQLQLSSRKLVISLSVVIWLLRLISQPVLASAVEPSMSHCDLWTCATTCAQQHLMSQWPDSSLSSTLMFNQENLTLTNTTASTTVSSN